MLRTLFDPVARFMGYMPSGSNPEGTPGELSVATESASIQPSRAHLRHEADFDYEKAKRGQFYFYHIGEVNGFAIGQHDWIPVSVLIGLLSGRAWLMCRLVDGTWIQKESALWNDWLVANEKCLQSLGEQLHDSESNAGAVEDYSHIEDGDVEDKVMVNVRYNRLAMEYLRVMAVAFPPNAAESFSLAEPPEVIRYHQAEITRALYRAVKNARESADQMAVSWLQKRGFEVDSEHQLVRVPGYQPLFYVGAQEI